MVLIVKRLKQKFSKTYYYETPHGGVKMTAFFFDKNGNPCTEKKCHTMQIVEYDSNDTAVFTLISTP